MNNILIILAHPDMERSRINRALIEGVKEKDCVAVSDLYNKYPDFNIDVTAEQSLLAGVDIVILQYPFYWYSCPPMLKQWMDKILLPGFAYGKNGSSLAGKLMLCAVSADGTMAGYQKNGYNFYTLNDLLRPVELTAKFCKMYYCDPFVVYDTDNITEEKLREIVTMYSGWVYSL
jgi:glutathione-regulated potassium-efflux system ancillary protein KefG